MLYLFRCYDIFLKSFVDFEPILAVSISIL